MDGERPERGSRGGALAGTVTQNSTPLTFILVSMLRSGLISTRGALIVLIGGNIGVTLLVLVVTFDIELISMCVLGVAGVAMISERLSRYRPIAASFFGGAMIILGLVPAQAGSRAVGGRALVRVGWVGSMEGSLVLAFLIGALLTFIVQSVIVVCVVGVSVATLGVITIDQTIMLIYGSVPRGQRDPASLVGGPHRPSPSSRHVPGARQRVEQSCTGFVVSH